MRVSHVVFDCNDIDGTPAFWASILDLKETARTAEWVDLEPLGAGGPMLSFQRVPEGKVVKNRLHLHVAVTDFAAATRTLALLRATEASPVRDGRGGSWQIWRDPEGNELCLVTG